MRGSLALVLAIALASAPGEASAQARGRESVELQVPAASDQGTMGPIIVGRELLADRRVRDLLKNGFPARLHYRVELWKAGGWFDDLERFTEWDVIVRFDPLSKTYRAAMLAAGQVIPLAQSANIGEVATAIEQPYRVPLIPGQRRVRYYYSAALDVEIISLSDLDEVERWLRGELRPAVRGERNPGTAITRGVRTLFLRLLGAEQHHYETRSPTFRPL